MNLTAQYPVGTHDPRAGSALITVMIVAMTVLIAAGGLHTVSISMPYRVRQQTDMIRSKAIAEAGINHGYMTLRNDFAAGLLAFPIGTNFAGGRYDVRLITNGLEVGEARLISIGKFGNAEAEVGVEARNAGLSGSGGASGPDPLWPFGQAIFSNGTLTINGTPKGINGTLFTNQEFALNGEYTNVEGKIYARSYKNDETPPGALHGAWAERPFPKLDDPDFAAFIEEARANGTLTEFNGSTTFPRDHVYNGLVVVRGDLTHNGAGSRTVNGMLYVTGNVTFNGSSSIDVTGSMIAGGNVTFNGASIINSGFVYDDSVTPTGTDPVPEDHVVIDAWWD